MDIYHVIEDQLHHHELNIQLEKCLVEKKRNQKDQFMDLLDNAGIGLGFDEGAFSDGVFTGEENSDSDDEVVRDAQFMDANDITLGFE